MFMIGLFLEPRDHVGGLCLRVGLFITVATNVLPLTVWDVLLPFSMVVTVVI